MAAANGELLGLSVAGAGDIDGDGFADLIIGAPFADTIGGTEWRDPYMVFGGTSISAISTMTTLLRRRAHRSGPDLGLAKACSSMGSGPSETTGADFRPGRRGRQWRWLCRCHPRRALCRSQRRRQRRRRGLSHLRPQPGASAGETSILHASTVWGPQGSTAWRGATRPVSRSFGRATSMATASTMC